MIARPHQPGVTSLLGFRRRADKPRRKQVTAMVDEATYEFIRAEAARTGTSRSEVLQKILERVLKA